MSERAVVFEENEELMFEKLQVPNEVILPTPTALPPSVSAFDPSEWFNEKFTFPPEGFQLEEAINRLIQHALNQTGHNVSAAARLLGVSRDYVRYRLAGQKQQHPGSGSSTPVS